MRSGKGKRTIFLIICPLFSYSLFLALTGVESAEVSSTSHAGLSIIRHSVQGWREIDAHIKV